MGMYSPLIMRKHFHKAPTGAPRLSVLVLPVHFFLQSRHKAVDGAKRLATDKMFDLTG